MSRFFTFFLSQSIVKCRLNLFCVNNVRFFDVWLYNAHKIMHQLAHWINWKNMHTSICPWDDFVYSSSAKLWKETGLAPPLVEPEVAKVVLNRDSFQGPWRKTSWHLEYRSSGAKSGLSSSKVSETLSTWPSLNVQWTSVAVQGPYRAIYSCSEAI